MSGRDATYIGMKAWDMGFDAHLTIMYLGPMSYNERNTARWLTDIMRDKYREVYVLRNKIEIFAENTPVITVVEHENSLTRLRKWFEEEGLVSPSTFPFNPHISLNLDVPSTLHLPPQIKLSNLNLY